MARRRIKRSSLFTVVAVVALLSLGIGYASWNTTLTIGGTVSTADVDVRIDGFTANEVGATDPSNIATCSADISDIANGNVSYSVTNAFPDYECDFSLTVKNYSANQVEVVHKSALPALLPTSNAAVWTVDGADGFSFDFTGCAPPNNLDEGTILAAEGAAGDTAVCNFKMIVDSSATPGDNFSGEMTIVFGMPGSVYTP